MNTDLIFSNNSVTLASGLLNISTNTTSGFGFHQMDLNGVGPDTGSAVINVNSATAFNFGSGGLINLSALSGAGAGLTYNINAGIILGGNVGFFGNGTANFNFTGAITGAFEFTKNDSSTIAVSGTNTFGDGSHPMHLDGGIIRMGTGAQLANSNI